MSADNVERVQTLRKKIEAERQARSTAEAQAAAAEEQLQALLAEHECSTIDELEAKAGAAREEADRLITEVEAALA